MGVAGGLMMAGGATQAAGTVYGGLQARAAAKEQAKMLQREAATDETRATFAEQQGSLEAARISKERRRVIAAGLADYASGNVLLESTGSVGDWAAGTGEEYALDRQIALDNAATQAWGFRQNAAAKMAQAKLTRAGGQAAFVGSLLGASGSMISSGGSAFKTSTPSK